MVAGADGGDAPMRRRFLVLTALLPLAYALPALAEVEEYVNC